MKEGTVAFLIHRTAAPDVRQIRYTVSAPSDQRFNRLADSGYDFQISLP